MRQKRNKAQERTWRTPAVCFLVVWSSWDWKLLNSLEHTVVFNHVWGGHYFPTFTQCMIMVYDQTFYFKSVIKLNVCVWLSLYVYVTRSFLEFRLGNSVSFLKSWNKRKSHACQIFLVICRGDLWVWFGQWHPVSCGLSLMEAFAMRYLVVMHLLFCSSFNVLLTSRVTDCCITSSLWQIQIIWYSKLFLTEDIKFWQTRMAQQVSNSKEQNKCKPPLWGTQTAWKQVISKQIIVELLWME